MRTLNRREVGTLLGAGLLTSLATRATASGSTATSQTHKVDIRHATFEPETLTIKAGDTVSWTNHDIAPHTATELEVEWDTGSLARGESGEITFEAAGTHDYFCVFHPHMTGKIIITT